ncbi:G-protein coupled receptor dmsr-1-like [Anopheles ziemanni]|uniref:G-protein coupled receptor dmsr-1-like n=1 Tax=Anopheles coustani TaxID=139045 RepID=UPI002657F2A2|nr:G-protein coupled receptor dmsr-1-like [Anopheles coustani]XP_058167346.1 G-protein coupled receptor dmsr-1-like [Anopheles ziemanni]
MSSTELGEFAINVTEGPLGMADGGGNVSGPATAHLMYCGKALDDFHTSYARVHGLVCLVVCVFGSIANTLNIVVLTRREMRSPTNAILTGLAIADLLVMLDYMPYALNSIPYLRLSREERLTYGWAWYIMFHSIFAQICHTISIWLTVTLAIWRYIAVAYPQRNRQWCDMSKTLAAIFSSYVVCPFLAVPIYLSFSIQSNVELLAGDGNTWLKHDAPPGGGRNVTLYRLGTSQLVRDNPALLNVNFWIYSVVFKLIPCIALTILSLRLIGALLEAKQRRSQLTGTATGLKQIVDGRVVDAKGGKQTDKERQTDRTTRMLLAVLLLFLITEFPQGILGLLSAVLENDFFYNCYLKLGDVMDVLALVNSAINFILYCSMSRQFRSTFNDLFRPRLLDRWIAVPLEAEDERAGRGRHQDGATTQITQI